jgi:hypothetical protein
MANKLIAEIERQLHLKSEITSVGPPHVILNGHEVQVEIEKLRTALLRFVKLADAVAVNYPDETIIRCEVTAGDIRTAVKALEE